MKRAQLILLSAVIAVSQACNSGDSDGVDDTKDTSDQVDTSVMTTNSDTSMQGSGTTVDKDASDFAVKAAQGGMMEVELGNYAQANASQKSVKDFGAMMVKDHTQANEELKAIAASKNIILPTGTDMSMHKEMEDLMKKKGKEFDKEYVKMMLDDHEKDVKAFQDAANNSKDPEIKNFAAKTLPVLRMHLDSIKVIKVKY